jgi:hypothetical protein
MFYLKHWELDHHWAYKATRYYWQTSPAIYEIQFICYFERLRVPWKTPQMFYVYQAVHFLWFKYTNYIVARACVSLVIMCVAILALANMNNKVDTGQTRVILHKADNLRRKAIRTDYTTYWWFVHNLTGV